ncbi:MAG: prolipoprotein diacylglyceryl transferase [Desulfobacterales bacterium]|nr:prolipoprotein diacylglyceryl transferase [Desulfobacterales bacterium]
MHPILLQLGFIHIYTYGFFVALGFIVGISVVKKQAGTMGINTDQIVDLAFFILIAAILGARLMYVIINFHFFLNNVGEIVKIWNGGLVFYGGFITALITAILYCRIYQLPIGQIADIVAPGLAIGHAFGRIGCFFAGCCYGKTCDLPWAITFSHPQSLAPLGVELHPTQLYSVFANACLFGFLIFWRRYKRFHGEIFLIYMLLYGIIRFAIEFLRGDDRGDIYFHIFSISQIISLLLSFISLCALLWVTYKHQHPKTISLSKP